MERKHETIRIWSKSVKKLRLIYALTGVTMVKILDRILTEELEKIQHLQECPTCNETSAGYNTNQ